MTPAGQLIADALAATTLRELNRVQARAGDHKVLRIVIRRRMERLATEGRLTPILPPSRRGILQQVTRQMEMEW